MGRFAISESERPQRAVLKFSWLYICDALTYIISLHPQKRAVPLRRYARGLLIPVCIFFHFFFSKKNSKFVKNAHVCSRHPRKSSSKRNNLAVIKLCQDIKRNVIWSLMLNYSFFNKNAYGC